jgi:hypothetical protein
MGFACETIGRPPGRPENQGRTPVWRNGRRTGLKILGRVTSVWVRVPPPAPFENRDRTCVPSSPCGGASTLPRKKSEAVKDRLACKNSIEQIPGSADAFAQRPSRTAKSNQARQNGGRLRNSRVPVRRSCPILLAFRLRLPLRIPIRHRIADTGQAHRHSQNNQQSLHSQN